MFLNLYVARLIKEFISLFILVIFLPLIEFLDIKIIFIFFSNVLYNKYNQIIKIIIINIILKSILSLSFLFLFFCELKYSVKTVIKIKTKKIKQIIVVNKRRHFF